LIDVILIFKLDELQMKKILKIILLIVVILIFSQYKAVLTGYANFFKVDNPTYGENAAIVILSGGRHAEYRMPKALDMYKKGYADRLLLTTERRLNSKVAHLFPIFPENEQAFQKIFEELNIQVKFEVVPSLKGRGATSTFDEAYDLLTFCSKEKIKHLIIVTSSFHTRRALYAFDKVFHGSGIKVEASAASNEDFTEKNWWQSDRGISAYILEPVKFVVYILTDKNVTFIKNE
jgi:uncharacterized SAM-binding protein YcdF (DUF218 family)